MTFDAPGNRPSYLTNLDFTIGINHDGIRFGGAAGGDDFTGLVAHGTGAESTDPVVRGDKTGERASRLDGLAGVTWGERVVIAMPEPDGEPVPDERDFEMPPQHVIDAKVINAEAGEGARPKDPQGIVGPEGALGPEGVLGAEGALDPKVIADPKIIQDPKVTPDPKAIVPAPPPAAAAEPVKIDIITKFPLVENGQLPAPETVNAYIAGTETLLKSDGISDEQRRSACVDLYQMVMGMFDGTVSEYIFLPEDELSRRLMDGSALANLEDTILNMRNYIATIKFLCGDDLFWHELADIEDIERVLNDLEEAMNPSEFVDDVRLRERIQSALGGAGETGRRLRDRVGEAGGAAGRVIRDAGEAIGEILRLFPPIPGLPGGDRRFGH